MIELPSGTVTFLFTDIEGSTKLLQQLGADRYSQVLSDQRLILRSAFDAFGGTEIDTQGDSFFASFPRASQAVVAVVQIQRALVDHDWPKGVAVRVRMGLHTGEPWLIDEGYVGIDVHRAARIGHVGHGGQVLLSETTTALVQDELPEGVTLLDLGRHRLKDMRRPEPIHQLVIEGLLVDFPPLASIELVAPPGVVGVDGEFRAPREVGLSPYRGLSAFHEADAAFFFGREAFTDRLVGTIKERNLTAVIVGPSGSGKSSTVFAGLLPQLTAGGDWLLVHMRPGSQPFLSLTAALLPLVEQDLTETDQMVEVRKMARALQAGDLSLSQVVERALTRDRDAGRMLLVIDQFEELYTLCPDVETRQAFHDELLAAVAAGSQGREYFFSLLLTLRADFMGQALGHRPFADALQEGSLLLGPMNREELQAAIEKPAEKQGAAFETGLVARILDDVGEEPGNLPLLEFALTLLWDQLEQGWLTHAAYDEIGRVEGALARHADEVYAGLTESEQEQARRIFVQLVQPGEGTEDTRRIARRSDLVGVEWSLVQRLADERLMVTGQDESGDETVEVVHEALIRSWGQLQAWMEADREFRRWQEGLRVALRNWENSGKDDGALLRGVPLAQAEAWLAQRDVEVGEAEQEFVHGSGAAREGRAEIERTRLARERELEQRALRRLRVIVTVLVAASLVGILLTLAVFNQNQSARRNETLANQNAATADAERIRAEQEADGRATQQAVAEVERERAESERGRAEQEAEARATQQAIAEGQARVASARNLAGVAIGELNTDPQLGLLLALQAADQTYGVDGTLLPEAETALHEALRQASRLQLTISAQAGGPPYVSFSPDGSRLIVHYFSPPDWPAPQPDDTVTRVWDASTGELLHTFPAGFVAAQWPPSDQVGIAELSDSFELLVNIWDTRDGLKLSQTELEKIEEFSFDGIKVLSTNSDLAEIAILRGQLGNAQMGVWDLQTGENKLILKSVETESAGSDRFIQANIPTNLIFSQENDNIIFANTQISGAFFLRIWESDTLVELSLLGLGSSESEIYPIAISQNGEMLAMPLPGQILIQEMRSGEELARLVSPQADIFPALVFSPDGALFAAASADGRIYVWDLEASIAANSSQLLQTIATADKDIHDLTFSPDGTRLTSAAADGRIKVWDIRPEGGAGQPPLGEPSETAREGETSLALNPDGGQLAIARPGVSPSIWNTETGAELFSLPGETGPIEDISYSPDGSLLATCGPAGPLKIWEAASGQELYALDGYNDGGCALAFHPEGDVIALGFFKNAAGWWQNVALPGSGDDSTTTQELTIPFPWRGGQEGALTRLDFESHGNQLAGVTDLGSLRVWDPMDENPRAGSALLRSEAGYQSVVYSPNGPRLVTTGNDGTVKIWDTETMTQTIIWEDDTMDPIRVIPAHTGAVNIAAFSPDGRAVATASADRSIKIWDIDTGRNLLTLPNLADPVTDMAFSPDGTRLYAASTDGTVLVFILDDAELIELAKDHVIRSLTREECQTYLQVEECP